VDSVSTRSNAEFLLSLSIDQSFKPFSKLVRVTGTLDNLDLAVNLNLFFFKNTAWLYGNKNVPAAEILRGRRCLRTRTFILFGLSILLVLMGFWCLTNFSVLLVI
jgi:hypothetical protein